MSGSTVAVTGATGFIGKLLVQSLIKDGWKVRALTRTPRVSDEFTQWITGDLDDPVALQSLVKDVSAVVHCAGVVRGSSLKEFTHTNGSMYPFFIRCQVLRRPRLRSPNRCRMGLPPPISRTDFVLLRNSRRADDVFRGQWKDGFRNHWR